jgi:Fe-S oxidoreductase
MHDGLGFLYPSLQEEDIKQYNQILYNRTTCGMCGTVCPAGIDTIELWEITCAKSLFLKLFG